MRLAIIVFVILSNVALAKTDFRESYYVKKYCEKFAGDVEYVLQDMTRVDCMTEDETIEFDFARKWAEAIGQSLHYALMSGRKPAIALIMRSQKDYRYLARMERVIEINKLGINVYVIDTNELK